MAARPRRSRPRSNHRTNEPQRQREVTLEFDSDGMTTSTLRNSTCEATLLSADDPTDAHLWNSLVDGASTPDVYYRPGYAKAYQAIDHGKAVAVLIETRELRALFPLLLRPLNALPFVQDETGFDAITSYGYGGLLLLDAEGLSEKQARELLVALREWCRENEVISAHVRLHPVLRQEAWFSGAIGEDFHLSLVGPTTAIDVNQWNAETSSIATLNKGRRSDLNFARRRLRFTWTSDGRPVLDDLREFYRLYEHRMTELEAGEYYHFSFDYYQALAEELGQQFNIALAWLNDRAVGGALFMIDRMMAHYHLSATNDLGRAHKASTLLLNGGAERARLRGCKYLHLGGGARGEDKLFAFKQSFGGAEYRYSYLSLVCDPVRYGRLVERRTAAANLPALRTNFFPAYRA